MLNKVDIGRSDFKKLSHVNLSEGDEPMDEGSNSYQQNELQMQ